MRRLRTRWRLGFRCVAGCLHPKFPSKDETSSFTCGHIDEDEYASFSARTVSAMKPSGDSELDRLLWEATMDEVEAGFLSGPYPVEHLP